MNVQGSHDANETSEFAVENNKEPKSGKTLNTIATGELLPRSPHNVEQQELGAHQFSQEHNEKSRQIKEEKDSLVLQRRQITDDLGKEGLSEETKKSLGEQLCKIKNRLRVLQKKSQMLTLSAEQISHLKSVIDNWIFGRGGNFSPCDRQDPSVRALFV